MILYLVFLYLVVATSSTGLCSTLHGGNHVPKLVAVALHLIMSPVVAAIFWLVFRRHKQADAELDLFGDSVGNYEAVRKAYYFWPLGAAMARTMRYCMEHPWSIFGTVPTRTQQELCHGVAGLILGVLTAILYFVF